MTSLAPQLCSVVIVGDESKPSSRALRGGRRNRRKLPLPTTASGDGHTFVTVGADSRPSTRASTLRLAASAFSSLSAGSAIDYGELERRLGLLDAEEYKSIVVVEEPRPASTPPDIAPAPPEAPQAPPAEQKRQRHNSEPSEPPTPRPRRPQRRGFFPPAPLWAPPLPPPMGAAAFTGGGVEMTGWRLRPQFEEDRRPLTNAPGGGRRREAESVLMAEDLPRMYPGPGPVPRWTRSAVLDFDEEEESDKSCLNQALLVRAFIGLISSIGVACIIVGVVLGAAAVSGTTRLTLCLLMIGVGVVLLTVSGIAWRLTSFDPNTSAHCCGLLRRRRERGLPLFHQALPSARHPYFNLTGRPPRPPMGVPGLFPDFPWQPPPPSYQATVREAQFIQLADPQRLERRPLGSPPPTYRPESRRTRRPPVSGLLERPPSYRSADSLPRVVVEERPFSRQGPAAVAIVEPVAVDDTDRLLRSEESVGPPPYRTRIEVSGEDAVIDCSAATPRGLRMPQDQGEIRRSLGRSAGARASRALEQPRPPSPAFPSSFV